MTVQEDRAIVEASLGGRIDSLEMRAFAEDLEEVLESLGANRFYLLIDHSRAKTFDGEAAMILSDLKDKAFGFGAEKIVTMACDEDEIARHTTTRLQQVLEGREQFCLEMPAMQAPSWQRVAVLRAA
ncbi:MAG: hypothetical protein H7Y17_00035 [Chlorobia bacterium]|nr:hypothetical protein [Fimbriimonadaceae bacterium]